MRSGSGDTSSQLEIEFWDRGRITTLKPLHSQPCWTVIIKLVVLHARKSMKLVLVKLIGLPVREAVLGQFKCRVFIQSYDLFDVPEQLTQPCSGATVHRDPQLR